MCECSFLLIGEGVVVFGFNLWVGFGWRIEVAGDFEFVFIYFLDFRKVDFR